MGGSDICMDQTRRACGGRLMAVRAVCADAGEDMPELVQKETRCASAPWLPSGGGGGGGGRGARVVETYQEMRVLTHTCVMTCGGQRAAGAGCRWSGSETFSVSQSFLAIPWGS